MSLLFVAPRKVAPFFALVFHSFNGLIPHVIAKFREELRKVGVKRVIVRLQFGDRFPESDWPAKSGAHSLQCLPNAINFTIGAQQIGSFDLLKAKGSSRRKIPAHRCKGRVNRGAEILQGRLGIAIPVAGQKVVVKHVDEDSAESSKVWAEKENTAPNDGMRVREGVDLTMPLDPALKLRAKLPQLVRAKNIWKEIPDSKSGRRFREKEMGQPVHGVWGDRAPPATRPSSASK